jgi:hypothetical protein
VLRLSDPAATAAQVAVAILHVLLRAGQLLHAAEEVAAGEILLGVTVIFPRRTEVLSGFTEVVAAVAVAMVTVMAVVTMMVVMVVLVEQITDETSDETSDERQTEHSAFSLSARGARACFMPTLGCLQTSPSSHKPIGPSVMCRTLRPVRHSFAASPAAARARKALKCSVFQRNGDVIAGAIA